MSSYSDLKEIGDVIENLDQNKIARLAYTETAFDNDDADGVDAFDRNKEQNIPSIASVDYNPSVYQYGIRTQGASMTRQVWNHYIGRASYNINKIVQKVKGIVNILVALIKHNGFRFDSAIVYEEGDACFDLSEGMITWYERNDVFSSVPVPLTNTYWDVLTDTAALAVILANISNSLTDTSTTKALSAAQGKALQDTKAPINSPTFTGIAKVPSKATAATSDGALIATEAQVALKANLASPTFTGTVKVPSKTAAATSDGTLVATEAQVALKANLASPTFTGTVKVPSKTAAAANDGTLVATEAQVALKANLASPTFTGTPKIGSDSIAVVAANTGLTDTNLPIGSYILCYGNATAYTVNNTIAPRLPNADQANTVYVDSGSTTLLSGTWRVCGRSAPYSSNVSYLCRRLA